MENFPVFAMHCFVHLKQKMDLYICIILIPGRGKQEGQSLLHNEFERIAWAIWNPVSKKVGCVLLPGCYFDASLHIMETFCGQNLISLFLTYLQLSSVNIVLTRPPLKIYPLAMSPSTLACFRLSIYLTCSLQFLQVNSFLFLVTLGLWGSSTY